MGWSEVAGVVATRLWGGDVRFIGWCEVSEVRLYVGVLGTGRRRV